MKMRIVGGTRPYLEGENPHLKSSAASAVKKAMKSGLLVRPEVCGSCGDRPDYPNSRPLIIAHHEDYAKPLQVRWLCNACHKAAHRVERTDIRLSPEIFSSLKSAAAIRQVTPEDLANSIIRSVLEMENSGRAA